MIEIFKYDCFKVLQLVSLRYYYNKRYKINFPDRKFVPCFQDGDNMSSNIACRLKTF